MNRRSFLFETASLTALQPDARRTVLLGSVKENRILSVQGSEAARQFALPPGSTLKPFVLLALLEDRKLQPREEFSCPGRLQIQSRQFNCSHPRLSLPMNASRAISYSCNCALEYFTRRFDRDALVTFLKGQGLNTLTHLLPGRESSGFVQSGLYGPQLTLQALGEEGVHTTPLELLRAYRNLAGRTNEPAFEPILSGLEGAVEFGTAQNARLSGVRVAGKTGTVRTASGNYFGWFAGFAPSRRPEVAVTVLVPGRSGGSDAAPIASKTLGDYFMGTL